jgi:hypothetical protein
VEVEAAEDFSRAGGSGGSSRGVALGRGRKRKKHMETRGRRKR